VNYQPSKTMTVLRWVAFLPAAMVVNLFVLIATGLILESDLNTTNLNLLAKGWWRFVVWTTGAASSVCVGAWTAPSYRRLAALLVSLVSVWLFGVLDLPAFFADKIDPLLLPGGLVTGLVFGVILVRWDRTKPRRVLRWVAVLPAVLTLDFLAFVLTHLVIPDVIPDIPGEGALAALLWGTSAIIGVYAGARIAPSARRLAGVLSGLALCWKIPLTLMGSPGVDTLFLIPSLVCGVACGLALIWRDGVPRASMITDANPRRYKGTAPFQDSAVDRKTFFGREAEGRSLLNLVLAERLVVLFAKSGMGKSSLLNADLAEALRRQGYLPLFVRLGDPERDPLALLFDGVRKAADEAEVELVGGHSASAWHFFTHTEFWSSQQDLLRPVLILDQFEELFTLHPPGPRQGFIRHLAELVRGRGAVGSLEGAEPSTMDAAPDLKIVIALREDFLAELEELARAIPGILHHRFRLGPLSPEAASRAIVEPAAVQDAGFATSPFRYREEAVERIISFLAAHRKGGETVAGDAVEPTQLQLICQYLEELARSRQGDAGGGAVVAIVARDIQDEDRLRQVLEDFYDRTLATVHPARLRKRLRRLCEQRLISNAGRRLTEDEEEIVHRHKISRDLLRRIVDARLLRPEPRLGGIFYELSHDTLVDPIRRSQKRRRTRKRRILAVTAAYLLVASAAWWLVTGREEAQQQQDQLVLRQLVSPIPDPDDPAAFESLARARLDSIQENFGQWVRSRDLFGAMTAGLWEVDLRYPTLRADARSLILKVVGAFQLESGLKSPMPEEDEPLNRRVFIEGGTFLMGTPEGYGDDDERPAHEVTISPFSIQQHEVSNAEYRRFDPSHDPSAEDDLPAVNVSWWEAAAYAAWIGGRLPTEAEWEYACRAGSTTRYSSGDTEKDLQRVGWYQENSGGKLHPVKVKDPNAWGLYDMHGNVREWVADWYGSYSADKRQDPPGPPSGVGRVMRGGSFRDSAPNARSAFRDGFGPRVRWRNRGFRVVVPVAPEP
jgi:formylglycine-generating enzyme required for sulfatase activity